MKKRLLALFLAGMLALTLTACGGDKGGNDAPPADNTGSTDTGSAGTENKDTKEGYKIALCMSHQTNAFTIAVGKGAQEKAAELGVTLDILDGKQDQATQTSQIEQCISSGYDGILVEPVSVDGIVPAVKEANEAGVPVITVVQTMSGQDEYAKAYRGGNDTNAGELQMQSVVDLLDGKGSIAVLYGPMGSDGQLARKAGYDKVLEKERGDELE